MKWSPFELAIAGVVTAVWAAAFIVPLGESTDRLLIQAAMMTVLGAMFGRRILRRDE